MRRAEILEGVRMMRFRDVFGRCKRREYSKLEAAELLGMSERQFRRYRRFEAEGEAGLRDRRLGKPSAKRVPADEAMRVERLHGRGLVASSPEARGRCERAFRTLQDRLPKVCVQEERVVGTTTPSATGAAGCRFRRDRSGRTTSGVRVHDYPDATLALFHARCLARYGEDGSLQEQTHGRRDPLRPSSPVDKATTLPTGATTTEAVKQCAT